MHKIELTIGTAQGRNYSGLDFFGPAEILEKTIESLTVWGVDAFTVFDCRGYWRGMPEDSFRFEIWLEDGTEIGDGLIRELAFEIQQDCIMVSRNNHPPKFIG